MRLISFGPGQLFEWACDAANHAVGRVVCHRDLFLDAHILVQNNETTGAAAFKAHQSVATLLH